MNLDLLSQYLMSYLCELSLSIDNLFVFVAIFEYFKIQSEYQYKCLYTGIVGAMVLRAICIVGGVWLLQAMHPLIYLLGGLLIFTAYKVFKGGDNDEEFDKTPWAQWLQKHFAFDFSDTPHSRGKFITHRLTNTGFQDVIKTAGTKLLFALLVIEFTDLIFATDSIPAALGCSSDPFIVYTSNIMAVLGLRSLFFALQALMDKLTYLKYGISIVLFMIGIKMVLSDLFCPPTWIWLAATGVILTISVMWKGSEAALKEEINGNQETGKN